MDSLKRISKVFKSAEQIPFDDSSRIVLMSDCHRGDGTWADEFFKNQNIYFSALEHYYKEHYTYIEIGDGDELWKNSKFSDIAAIQSNIFWLMSKFYNEKRLYVIFGNHDIVKKDKKFVKDNLYKYYDEREKKYVPLFPDIKVHEGLILRHRVTNNKIFLIHGHQVDFLNSNLWRLSRMLVRHLLKPLEIFGVNDPTSAAKNYDKKQMVEEKLTEWVEKEKQMLIAGHTHRPMFPDVEKPQYFNDGSSVHPRCITAIEIIGGQIMLVKWCMKTKEDGVLYIGKDILAGPTKLQDYFDAYREAKRRGNSSN